MLLFPFLAAVQPIISCTDVIKSYADFESPLVFEETVVTPQKILSSKGITIFATIEHYKAAEAVGKSMPPVTVLIVGNPKVGTTLVQESPRFTIELPLKILIYEENRAVKIRYEKITAMGEKYHIKQTFNTAEKIDAAMLQLIKPSTGEWKIIIFAALLYDDRIVTYECWVMKGLTITTPI